MYRQWKVMMEKRVSPESFFCALRKPLYISPYRKSALDLKGAAIAVDLCTSLSLPFFIRSVLFVYEMVYTI